MFRAGGVWAAPKVGGLEPLGELGGQMCNSIYGRINSISLASVLTTNAGSSVHFCLIETAVKCMLNLLVQIINFTVILMTAGFI